MKNLHVHNKIQHELVSRFYEDESVYIEQAHEYTHTCEKCLNIFSRNQKKYRKNAENRTVEFIAVYRCKRCGTEFIKVLNVLGSMEELKKANAVHVREKKRHERNKVHDIKTIQIENERVVIRFRNR